MVLAQGDDDQADTRIAQMSRVVREILHETWQVLKHSLNLSMDRYQLSASFAFCNHPRCSLESGKECIQNFRLLLNSFAADKTSAEEYMCQSGCSSLGLLGDANGAQLVMLAKVIPNARRAKFSGLGRTFLIQ